MVRFSKAFIGSLALGATALTSAAPAMARDYGRDRGIDGGDILTGALVLGGVAAVIAATSDNDRDDRRYDRRYDDRNDRGYGDRRNGYDEGAYRNNAVQQCVRAAETTAARYNYGTRAEVYDIRDVDRESRGFEVRGRIAVQERGRNYRGDNWDEGSFTCDVRGGRVVDLDYSGIRGL